MKKIHFTVMGKKECFPCKTLERVCEAKISPHHRQLQGFAALVVTKSSKLHLGQANYCDSLPVIQPHPQISVLH